jgi:hypothetical protein
MSAILGNAQILGLTLLSQEGFFGTFSHVYNMLVEIHVLLAWNHGRPCVSCF